MRLVSIIATVGIGVEVVGIMQMSAWVGGWATAGLLLAGVIVGVQLSRTTGTRAMAGVQRALAEGRPPGPEIVGGLLTFLAAVLFMVPGFITDLVAIVLLLPPVRWLLAPRLAAKLLQGGGGALGVFGFTMGGQGMPRGAGDDGVIDVEAEPVARAPLAELPPVRRPGDADGAS